MYSWLGILSKEGKQWGCTLSLHSSHATSEHCSSTLTEHTDTARAAHLRVIVVTSASPCCTSW